MEDWGEGRGDGRGQLERENGLGELSKEKGKVCEEKKGSMEASEVGRAPRAFAVTLPPPQD